MFKDDRFISILSGVVLMLAIGTLVQRGDVIMEMLGQEPAREEASMALNPDTVVAQANSLTRINVLANDTGVPADPPQRLVITGTPSCGRVFVQGDTIQYLPDDKCTGAQAIAYSLAGMEGEAEGRVAVSVVSPSAPVGERRRPVRDDVVALRQTDIGARVFAPRASAPSGIETGITDGLGGDTAPRAPSAPTAPAAGQAPSLGGGMSAPSVAERPSIALAPGGLAPAAPSAPQVALAPVGQPSAPTLRNPGQLDGGARTIAVEGSGSDLAPAPPQIAELAPGGAGDLSIGAEPSVQSDGFALGLAGGSGVDRTPTASMSLARIDRMPVTAVPAPAAPSIPVPGAPGQPRALDAPVPRAAAPQIDQGAGAGFALAAPTSGLGAVLTPNTAMSLAPVDTSLPAGLSAPRLGTTESLPLPGAGPVQQTAAPAEDTRTAAIDPDAGALPAETASDADTAALAPAPAEAAETPRPAPVPAEDTGPVAALPSVTEACVVTPSMTLELRLAAITALSIDSPCNAGQIATLEYEGLTLAARLDAEGKAQIIAPGFGDRADAVVTLEGLDPIAFEMPFDGIERVERIALAWEMPVTIELHALEFGADLGEEGHIGPETRSAFENVRRSGGGFMSRHTQIDGIGMNVEFYTHYVRRGTRLGGIKMLIDFASRHAAGADFETCGDGHYASPNFTVYRTSRGIRSEPVTRRLAALACDRVVRLQNHMISSAVRDIVITRR